MARLIQQVALVSDVSDISFSDLTRTSAALQKQATRDLGPTWDVEATVDAFAKLEDVPLGYWPVIVQSDIGFDAAGIHLDKDGQPFALVNGGDGWQLTASHEVLEMLVDPFGNRVVAGDSPKPDQGRVEFLVEVCDPSEAAEFGYTVNGILVSDFYTPRYFDPVQAPGVRYSFTGAITEPRQVLKGGYLSWHDPVSDHWWQLTFFGSQPRFRDLGRLTSRTQSIRAQIDRITSEDSYRGMTANRAALAAVARSMPELVMRPSESKAQAWRAQIERLKAGSGDETTDAEESGTGQRLTGAARGGEESRGPKLRRPPRPGHAATAGESPEAEEGESRRPKRRGTSGG